MRSTAIAIVAGAVILVAAVAVLIRLQKPSDIGARSPEAPRPQQATRADNAPGDASRSDRLQERLRKLREEHAARRMDLPKAEGSSAGRLPSSMRELP